MLYERFTSYAIYKIILRILHKIARLKPCVFLYTFAYTANV